MPTLELSGTTAVLTGTIRGFGRAIEYLSPVLAAHLSSLFNNSTVYLADGASHWPQRDQPEVVARLIKGDIS